MPLLARWWAFCATALLLLSVFVQGSAGLTQDDTQSTVTALQTQAAGLKTMVALQTEVATLSTQVASATAAPGESTTANGEVVLYEADWSKGLADWDAGPGWDVFDGMLIADGTQFDGSYAWAPYELGETVNYYVEAEIQALNLRNRWSYGVMARQGSQGGYFGGYVGGTYDLGFVGGGGYWSQARDSGMLQYREMDLYDNDWRVYRLEVEGNVIRLLIDGSRVAVGEDNQFREGGFVGLWSAYNTQINVRSFRVVALP